MQNKDELNSDEIKNILNTINNFRNEYEVPNLIYDEELTLLCKERAINFLKSKVNNSVLQNNISQRSENMTFINGVRNKKMINILNIIKKWYSENKFYDFENDEKSKYKSCQNFINLVWESNIKCGFWYSYTNGKCVLCMQFIEK